MNASCHLNVPIDLLFAPSFHFVNANGLVVVKSCQNRLNYRFFSNSRRHQAQTKSNIDALKYQQLISTDLWIPSIEFRKPNSVSLERITAESMNLPQLIHYPTYKQALPRHAQGDLNKLGLPPKTSSEQDLYIPDIRPVEDYEEGWNPQVTTDFTEQYKKGYIVTYATPEPHLSSISIKTPNKNASVAQPKFPKSKTPNSIKSPARRTPFFRTPPARPMLIPKKSIEYTHPTRFTKRELSFVMAAFKVYGTDWIKISQIFHQTKSPMAIQSAWKRSKYNWNHITPTNLENVQCQVCFHKILLPSQISSFSSLVSKPHT